MTAGEYDAKLLIDGGSEDGGCCACDVGGAAGSLDALRSSRLVEDEPSTASCLIFKLCGSLCSGKASRATGGRLSGLIRGWKPTGASEAAGSNDAKGRLKPECAGGAMKGECSGAATVDGFCELELLSPAEAMDMSSGGGHDEDEVGDSFGGEAQTAGTPKLINGFSSLPIHEAEATILSAPTFSGAPREERRTWPRLLTSSAPDGGGL